MLLVTGKNGQLGRCLEQLLPHAIFTSSKELDITNSIAVQNFVEEHNITTIINCAAYTAVDKAEDEEGMADLVNHYGPMYLARTGAKVIHVSTDYVFDGKHHSPYKETDQTNPLTVYGRTKLAGERALVEMAEVAVVIRTSWLYSNFGNNFVKTMLRLGNDKHSISVVCDQVGSPTYAFDLAKAIVSIIPQINKSCSGIYHYSNSGQCSWFDFASAIMNKANLPCRVMPISSSNYYTKATRPQYSVLDNTKILNTFGVELYDWKVSLSNMLESHHILCEVEVEVI